MSDEWIQKKEGLLCTFADVFVGVTERGGNNSGQIVEMFQSVIGEAVGEAWCLAFVQFCVRWTDRLYDGERRSSAAPPTSLYGTEHCMTLWQEGQDLVLEEPRPGCLMLWQHHKWAETGWLPTAAGHVGIVIEVHGDGTVTTIEGNTGDGEGVVREGDGVFVRRRKVKPNGSMRVVGFMAAWK